MVGNLRLEIDIVRKKYVFVTALLNFYFWCPLEQKRHYVTTRKREKDVWY